MKIGVFGDSFASKFESSVWWNYLEDNYNCSVECFGEPGSSLGFSVNLIQSHAMRFDFIIWCVTSVNRISFWHKDQIYHNTGQTRPNPSNDVILNRRRHIVHDYLTNDVFDWHFQETLGHALVWYMLNQLPNLAIIPCFSTPVYFMKEHKFNLYELCLKEIQACHPNVEPFQYVNGSRDLRKGHLCQPNQRVLAKFVKNNLVPGIMIPDYNDFEFDKSLLSKELL